MAYNYTPTFLNKEKMLTQHSQLCSTLSDLPIFDDYILDTVVDFSMGNSDRYFHICNMKYKKYIKDSVEIEKKIDLCCGVALCSDDETSEAFCKKCGYTVSKFEICSDLDLYQNNRFIIQKYHSNTQTKLWLNRIMGRPNSRVTKAIIDSIVIPDNLKLLTPIYIRKQLQKNQQKKLLNYTTEIRYRILKLKPPVLSKELETRILKVCSRLNEPILNSIKFSKNVSHMYLLYKVVEMVLPNNYPTKKEILGNFILPSFKTQANNLIIYKQLLKIFKDSEKNSRP